MPLDKAQQDYLKRWLESKNVSQACPACGASNWQAGDVIASPVLPGGGGTVIGGPMHPMVQVICTHCAHVRLFSSVAIGLPLYSSSLEKREDVRNP